MQTSFLDSSYNYYGHGVTMKLGRHKLESKHKTAFSAEINVLEHLQTFTHCWFESVYFYRISLVHCCRISELYQVIFYKTPTISKVYLHTH